jgi:hypothetical protein
LSQLRSVLTGDRLSHLATLGRAFDPGFGNYVQTFPADRPTGPIAVDILRTLTEAYAADAPSLAVQTTWIAEKLSARQIRRCGDCQRTADDPARGVRLQRREQAEDFDGVVWSPWRVPDQIAKTANKIVAINDARFFVALLRAGSNTSFPKCTIRLSF